MQANDFDIDFGDCEKPPPLPPRKPYVRKKYPWVKKTEKHIRYKVFHTFKYNPVTQKRSPTGKYFYIYEHADKLVFILLNYGLGSGKKEFHPQTIGVLKYKNGGFNFYCKTKDRKWANRSNNIGAIKVSLSLFDTKLTYIKRIKRVINHFCKKVGYEFKTNKGKMSTYDHADNIASGILRLCYPGLNKLKLINEDIIYVYPKYARALRKPSKKFINSITNHSSHKVRYFKQVYATKKDPLFTHYDHPKKDYKFIKLDDSKAQFINPDNSPFFYGGHWKKEEFEKYLKAGKFQEIPLSEAVLML